MDAWKRKVKKVWKELDQQSFRKLLARYMEMLQTIFDAEGRVIPDKRPQLCSCLQAERQGARLRWVNKPT